MERARLITQPEPGFFTVKLVKGGPFVPARIYHPCPIEMGVWDEWNWLDRRWPDLVAEIDGEEVEIDRVWLWGRPTTFKEFEFLSHRSRWAHASAPHHPAANPRERIDLGKLPPVY